MAGMIVLCAACFACGGVVRDGWPTLHSTHAARALGAAFCGFGAFLVGGWEFGLVVFGGIFAGFYLDMKHGEAAGVDTPQAVFDAFLSGVTSLVPLALALGFFLTAWAGAIVALGLLKPAIWKLSWLTRVDSRVPFFEPTRVAAAVFHLLIGCGVAITHSLW